MFDVFEIVMGLHVKTVNEIKGRKDCNYSEGALEKISKP